MIPTLFYILAGVAVIATLLCITEKHTVHAVLYLVTSFFSLAMIFFMLGAPLVAVFEVIIYAGAIMVLFLFIIMMIPVAPGEGSSPGFGDWWPAAILGAVTLAAAGYLILGEAPAPSSASVDIKTFARTLFRDYGLAVEIVSLQLLFALVGAFYLGRRR